MTAPLTSVDDLDPPPLPEERLRAIQDELDTAQEILRDITARRNVVIRQEYERLPAAYIADVLGVHRQIIYRIIRRK